MKTNSFLLPYSWQVAGWVMMAAWLVFAGVRLLLYYAGCEIGSEHMFVRVLLAILWELPPYLSIMLICISREKLEDEYVQHVRALSVFSLALFLLSLGMLSFAFERLLDWWGLPRVSYWLTLSRGYFSLTPVAAILYIIIFKSMLLYNWVKSRANG